MTKDLSRYPEKSASLIVFIYGFRAFTVECNDGSRKGGRGGGGGGRNYLDFRPKGRKFFSLKSKFAKSKTFMGKQNNIVEKNVIRKINLVSCHAWIDCKLLTLATRYSCRFKVFSVITNLKAYAGQVLRNKSEDRSILQLSLHLVPGTVGPSTVLAKH